MIDPSQVRVTDDTPWPALLVQDGNHAGAAWVSVHSRRDPKRDAARQLDAAGADASSVLIVIGLGLGYLLDVLEERDWRGAVVALEPEPALADRHLLRRDWGTWTGARRLTVVRGPEYANLDALAPGLDPNQAEVVVVINPTLARLNRQGVEDALRRATGLWFGARANQEAKRQNGGRYLLNTLRNAPAIAREADAGALLGRFAGVPAILVAAGPSLDRNLPAIARGRDRALVVAVDTALRPLLAAGIEPDLVVGVDPTEANARHLAELPRCGTTYFVSEGSLDPEAWRAFEGRTFAFRVTGTQPWPWLQAGGVDRAKLRAWGSVLTTAFDLTLGMGCDPIVFTGADLGFTHDRPYARGTTYEEEWTREQAWGQTLEESWAMRLGSWPDLREPGVDGGPVRTAAHLVAFRDWIAAEAAKATGRTIVNATPGGILVGDGIALQPVERALAGSTPLAPSVRSHIADAYRTSAHPTARLSPPTIGHIDGWATSVGLDRESIVNAVDRTWSASAVDAARAEGDSRTRRPWWSDRPVTHDANDRTPASSTTTSPDPSSSDRSSSDDEYLHQLAAAGPLTLVRLRAPEQDLLAELRAHVPAVLGGSTLAVVDELGTSVGTQVRRALDELLCERPDLSLEYRRFVDHQARVSVLRAIAAHADPGGFQADAGKWHPDHRAVADRLVPLLMETFAPRSIVDIGCGAGYWLQAFASLGAMRLGGVTPHTPEDGPSLAPVVRSWMRHAPLGRIPPPA
ncbi:MAG: motility associated factor glycosyltransferase family protein, partial [Vicinamibacterales bacterium]